VTRVIFGRVLRPVEAAEETDGGAPALDPAGPVEAVETSPAAVAAEPPRDAALEEVLRFARMPLDPDGPDPEAAAFVRADRFRGSGDDDPAFRAALDVILAAHGQTTDAVSSVVASARARDDDGRADRVTLEALDAVRAFAARPPAPIHVHVPEQNVNVESPVVTVHVPEQAAPTVDVHVAAAEVTVPVPNVEVNVAAPEPAAPAETPVVNVTVSPTPVEVNVTPTPPLAARAVRLEHDEQGRRVYRTIEEHAAEDREA
jgi:hypothetical protein